MSLRTRTLLFCIGVGGLLGSATAADFPDVRDASYTEPNGAHVLQLSILIQAPLSKIWNLFISAEGWQSWAVPVAWVDFGVGGLVETSYNATAVRGAPENIKNAIVAYVPERLLVLRNIQAPPGFEHAEDFAKTVTVINLRRLTKDSTEVEMDGVGFLATPAFDSLLQRFRFGDSWTLEHLKRAAEHGPVDWVAEAQPDKPRQSK